ncbi:MAG TPA: DNA-binding response regulator [Porphyromonadaceae bacterium]|jgi:two-component system LytT family response regulator|uniref:LytR/AlgR family response regulator transcription factor n=1 Tax=Limibacterium fermenti TaxID=3229863 RepID=UPI000E9877B0|nr:DNA-binding response regulator [Porphyromonadaceae bacterium]HBK33199.1 DNA-binding response regulator [Porphyromonadaceae bacterium]HBL32515.1 DNA-binding response regulator [Porphyromonadaceae bacterium]HBX21614.1 DNA-binding response regulator [Porphyromonadaceae bacterium]HBX45988.1 DNA-binding response regulator [Porphyromonadaceae bacterium]
MANNLYTVAVIDDEPVCIQNLRQSLTDFPDLKVVGEAQTAKNGKKLILQEKPDLLFLDVELPDIDGLELLQDLQYRITWPMQVIFYTSYQKYWLDALRQSAFDYLLKPYSPKEFSLIIRRFFEHTAKQKNSQPFDREFSELLPAHQIFLVPDITGYQLIRINQIGFFSYIHAQRQWNAALSDGKQVLLRRNTKAGDILKASSSFIQINQQQIINLNYLCTIRGKNCRLIPPFEKEENLCVSRNFLKNLQDKFYQI